MSEQDKLYPLVDRLRCHYNGRDFGGKMEVVLPAAIMLEAAETITDQSQIITALKEQIALMDAHIKTGIAGIKTEVTP